MALSKDISLNELVEGTYRLYEKGERMTHLGICPMSEELIKAPIELAMQYGFPVLFVASRNQVSEDKGGGYVMGLDQESFLGKIESMEEFCRVTLGLKRPYLRFVSVDHCGPWYKEREKSLAKEEAIESVKRTLTACISAGYAGIHVDCSFEPPPHVRIDEEEVIRLTADLVEFAEEERVRLGKPSLSYEIGTEESAGAGVSAARFRESIDKMLAEFRRRRLPDLAFVVGKTGAKVKMLENVGGFDYTAASSLPRVAKEYRMGFKEHNADYLSTPILSLHPVYGITCANVGPDFAAAQTGALLELADLEEKSLGKGSSNLYNIMSNAVLQKAPFKKWLREAEKWSADELRSMPAELRAVTLTAGHYVYYDGKVREAILRLYSNLKKHAIVNEPEGYVVSAVKKAIMRYVDAFNLRGSTAKILKILG